MLTLTIPVSLGIVAFLLPISQIGRWSLGEAQGLLLVHMDSEWRREENSKKKVLIIKRSKPERNKEQTLRLEAQSCEGREDGGCQAGAEPIKWE